MAYKPATLTGLPRELGTMIASHLPPRAVGSMQRTSKRTQQFTSVEMKKLCETLPDEDELGDYLKYLEDVYDDRRVYRYDPIILQIARKQAGTYTIYYLVDINNWTQIRLIAGKEGESDGIPDPTTVLDILRRRVGCRAAYLDKHDVDGYGVNMARNYLRGVLRPFLLPIVGKDEEMLFIVGDDTDIDDLVRPIPTSTDEEEEIRLRKKYQNNLQHLRMLVWWMNRITDLEYEQDVDPGILRQEAVRLLEQIKEYSTNLFDLMSKLDEERDTSLPDHAEVVRWIRKSLVDEEMKRKGLRVSFLTDEYQSVVLETLNGNARIIGGLTLEEVLSKLPGRVDPNTLLTVMREREGKVEKDKRYGISSVRWYTTSILTDAGYSIGYTVLSDEEYIGQAAIEEGRIVTPSEYVDLIIKLRLLAVWMEAVTYEQARKWIKTDPVITDKINKLDVNILRRQAREVVKIVEEFVEQLADVAGGDVTGGDVTGGTEEEEEGEELGGETAEEEDIQEQEEENEAEE